MTACDRSEACDALQTGNNFTRHFTGTSIKKDLHRCKSSESLVGRERFELSTNGLKVRCSTG